jgi:PEP-CTERM motif-containing protein
MKKLILTFIALVTVLAVTPAAKADGFQFWVPTDSFLTGAFTYSVTGNTINSASLSIFSSNLSFYPAGGTFVFQPGSSFFINSNLAELVFTDGSLTIDLFNIGTGWQLEEAGAPQTDEFLTPAPEPSSLLLLGSGLFLLAACLFWKSRSKAHLDKPERPDLILTA